MLSGQHPDGEPQRFADRDGRAHATGTGEREGALELVDAHLKEGDTLGADKGYDVHDFVEALKSLGIRSHIRATPRMAEPVRSTVAARTARATR